MPNSTYFLFGDLISNLLTSLVVALCCFALFDTSWGMFPAMIVGMILGMVISMVLAIAALMRFFGAMEVMLPVMLSGMWSGMIISMRAAMGPLSLMDTVIYGLLIGLAVISLCWCFNSRWQGRQLEATAGDSHE